MVRYLLFWIALVGLLHEVSTLAPPALLQRRPASRAWRLRFSNTNNDNPLDKNLSDENRDRNNSFREKIAELDNAIAAAEAERQNLLRAELNRYDKKIEKPDETFTLVPVEAWTPRELKKPPSMSIMEPTPDISLFTTRSSSPRKGRSMTTRSKVTRSDAGTLVIEITPQGISSGVLFNGAFSVAWFSAVIPATFAAMSGGILTGLFLLPFWLAGGMVAKQAVVDPFISNKLSIGQYAWSVESRYVNSSIQKQEGSTENLQGAKVECPIVVNNVPQYQLSLYDSSKGVTSLGLGLPLEELEKVANDINEYLESVDEE